MKHYKSTNSTIAKAFAILLGVCLLVTPLQDDRISSAPVQKMKESILNNELDEDKFGAEKLK